MLTQNALSYTLSQLVKVAFPTEGALEYSYDRNEAVLELHLQNAGEVHLPLMTDDEAEVFRMGLAHPLNIASADGRVEIPVFRTAEAQQETISTTENVLKIPYDLITPSYWLLTQAQEYDTTPRDSHDRLPYPASIPAKYDIIHLPLVDEYAMLLRQWVNELLHPQWSLTPRTPRFIPTHDIDILYRFNNPWQAYKSILGRDLLIDKNIQLTKASFKEYKAFKEDKCKDPYILAILELIRQSKEHNLFSIFFFKAQKKGESDCTYDIDDSRVRYCIEQILDAGMGLGLHGSYRSYNNPEVFGIEKDRLEQVAGRPIMQSRQHYLRFNADTPLVWESNHISDDYTLGYADQPGFRCGTCHPHPLFDIQNDRATAVMEHPLIVMDGSLIDYLHLGIEESNRLIDQLRERCFAVEGDFVLLWHNHSTARTFKEMYNQVYLNQIHKQQ
ncbi:MAG: polysaccharide deacetylase family protein [Bacteroidales bacterium]|nr:polysaccharide deacetylase family protein [Bacteroidales bacterium]